MTKNKIAESLRITFGFVVFFCCPPLPAVAAMIEHHTDQVMGCDILMSGIIELGDAERLRELIDRSDQEISRAAGRDDILGEPMIGLRPPESQRVCFNSNGGSFVEALRIADLLIEYRKGAAVGAGMVCESACALAFMGGAQKVPSIEGSDDTDRVLHPSGLLGFHAPNLIVAEGQYNETSVQSAYLIALASLRAIVETRNTVHRSYVPGTDEAASFRYRFPESLLLAMLSTAPEDMRYVRTVGEASQWDIKIAPVRLPTTDEIVRTLASACDNIAIYFGEQMEFGFEEPPFVDALDGLLVGFIMQAADQVSNLGGSGSQGIRLVADMGVYWYECDVEVFLNGGALFDPVGGVSFGGRRYIYAYQFHEPQTRISTLVPNSASAALPAEFLAELSREIHVITSNVRLLSSCWLDSLYVRISNVNDYVNLRSYPDFSSPVIREIPLGEQVIAQQRVNLVVIGEESQRQFCTNACQAFGRNSDDLEAHDRAQQCIEDNLLWYEISDARGNRGWISRKFLQEVE